MSRTAVSPISIPVLMLRNIPNPQRAWAEQRMQAPQQSNQPRHPYEWKVWQVVLATLMIIAIEAALAYGSAQLGSYVFEVDPLKCGVITGGVEVGLSVITWGLLVLCEKKDKRNEPEPQPFHSYSQREVREPSMRRPLESFEESASERSEQKEESLAAPSDPRLGEDLQRPGCVIYSAEQLSIEQVEGLKTFRTKRRNIRVSESVDKNIQTFVNRYREACYFFMSDDNYCLYIRDLECPDRLEISKKIAIVNSRVDDLAKHGISEIFLPLKAYLVT